MTERIKLVRKTIGLTQSEFAERLGLAQNSIASYESGRRNPTEAVLKLICKEFNVDYLWLQGDDKVDMFRKAPKDIIDKLGEQYNLDEQSKIIVETYLNAPEEEKRGIENFLISLAENLKKK
ncbi:MAG: helix-turn-helix transcriptional regulator [Clostridium sp.]